MTADGADWHAIGRIVRDLEGGVLSAWPRSELQLQHAHRRSQLPRLGVRSSGGVLFIERLLFLKLLATGAYEKRYIHMVGRRGRQWATLFLFSVSTSCSLWQLNVACGVLGATQLAHALQMHTLSTARWYHRTAYTHH